MPIWFVKIVCLKRSGEANGGEDNGETGLTLVSHPA